MKYFIDHAMNKVFVLLDKKSNAVHGKILAYYSENRNGNVYYAEVRLYQSGWNVLKKYNPNLKEKETATGKAGGYGYDKFSTAVADSLHKMGLGLSHAEINAYTFRGNDSYEEREKTRKREERKIKRTGKIPVYGGTEQVVEPFELYFRVIEAL